MNRYTLEERAEIVILFIKNNESVISTQRNFRRKYPHRPAPTGKTIRRLCQQFRRSGTTADARHIGRPRTGRSIENIRRVRESIAEDPRTSTERRATQLGMSRLFVTSVGSPRTGGYVVATGRCDCAHIQRDNGHVAQHVPCAINFSIWRLSVAFEIARSFGS